MSMKPTDTLKKGELILSCSPFVALLHRKLKGQYCDHCFLR